MASAKILGGGVGALCCAALLCRKGWDVTLCFSPRVSSPTVVLNSVTIQIIRDIFGDLDCVLRDAQPITQHYINWGGNLQDEFAPSSGVTLRGDVLSARLLDLLRQDAHVFVSDETQAAPSERTFDWHIYATTAQRGDNNHSANMPARSFGQRYAMSVDVALSADSDCATSFIEATPGGWLFLAPVAQGRAVLQAVVPEKRKDIVETTCELLAHTKELKRIVQDIVGPATAVQCAPKKLIEMDGATWLATGTAACSYDPLCGDGSGYAIRAAILAAAVLEGIDRGNARESLLTYYKLRLTYAFYTHIRSCLSLYSAAILNESWRGELMMMAQGLCEVEQELSGMSTNYYRLNKFELLPMSA